MTFVAMSACSLQLFVNRTPVSSLFEDSCSVSCNSLLATRYSSLHSKNGNPFRKNFRSSLIDSSNWLSGRALLNESSVSQKHYRIKKTLIKASNSLGMEEEYDLNGERIAEDYYSILGLTPDATPDEIKKAYYSCMKTCHPDLNKNNPLMVEFCSFINEVYEVLNDPEMRAVYDEINGYTVSGINPFRKPDQVFDHCFVDEFTCIGCKNCANTAEKTFDIEPLYGRARVMSQSADPVPLIQEAIDTCPVNCIHWVSAAQLTLLEDEMRRVERVNVAFMLANMGSRGVDVFEQAAWRWDKRQAQAVERARIKLATEMKSKSQSWWNGAYAEATGATQDANLSQEKMARAAAAARRWREYSRSGVDRTATRFIPEMVSATQKASDNSDGNDEALKDEEKEPALSK